ncbi:MAG: hypothetical protein KGR26_08390, partial [Cyanobacteria bacterium REEB65]|nr:hypothetical protein [Cyanobacteria bacterium REEB65]
QLTGAPQRPVEEIFAGIGGWPPPDLRPSASDRPVQQTLIRTADAELDNFRKWADLVDTAEGAANSRGGRNKAAYDIASEGLGRRIDPGDVRQVVLSYCYRSGLPEHEGESVWRSACQRHQDSPFEGNAPEAIQRATLGNGRMAIELPKSAWAIAPVAATIPMTLSRPDGPYGLQMAEAQAPMVPWLQPSSFMVSLEGYNHGYGAGHPIAYMLDNYTLLHGTTTAWDEFSRKVITLDAMRASHKEHFASWQKAGTRKIIREEDLVFAPQGAKPRQINIFRGLEIGPPPPGASIARILAHFDAMCGGDEGLKRWILSWLAYPLQHMGAKMHTALVVHGGQGTGKGLLFTELMGRIYTRYSFIGGQMELESRYTGWLSGKLYIVFNEVSGTAGERRAIKNRLKSLITDPVAIIEEKFKPVRNEENHANLVFLSNEWQPVELESDDRRHTVIRVDLSAQDGYDAAYYEALVHEIQTGGAEAFLEYLRTLDLGSFGVATKPYVTEAQRDLIALSRPSAEAFLEQWLAGETAFPVGACKSESLWQAYRLWCQSEGTRLPAKRQEFLSRAKHRIPCRYADLEGTDRTRLRVYVPSGEIPVYLIRRQASDFDDAIDREFKNYHQTVKL